MLAVTLKLTAAILAVAIVLVVIWWVLAGLGDGCAWIAGFGGCR